MLSVLILGWESLGGSREVAVAPGPPWQQGPHGSRTLTAAGPPAQERGDVAGKGGRGTWLGNVAMAGGTWLRSPPLCSSGTGFVVNSQP